MSKTNTGILRKIQRERIKRELYEQVIKHLPRNYVSRVIHIQPKYNTPKGKQLIRNVKHLRSIHAKSAQGIIQIFKAITAKP